MAAWMNFVTRVLHEVEALTLPTNFLKCWLQTLRGLLHLLEAEPTRLCICLVASLSKVIGLHVAFRAEVFVAVLAPDSEGRHMLSSFIRHYVTLVVLLALDGLTWHKLHDIAALTAHHTVVHLDHFHNLILLYFFSLLFGHNLVQFPLLEDFGASSAFNLVVY